jgi:iron complex outermembrane receptor protein
VSKRPEAVGQAPSAIYVITHDEIARSGANSLPEILRLAPNLDVQQQSASAYVITARGFNGAPADQNFSNKLLVLIDGRSVYTPLYSGVYWDMQDVPVRDIERIEVISGPGATLWGANAVNGVINIITRKAADTQGGLIEVAGGQQERRLDARYGGHVGDLLAWRVYGDAFMDQSTRTTTGASNSDQWTNSHGGFRVDLTPTSSDTATVQGDVDHAHEDQLDAAGESLSNGELIARWTHAWNPDAALQAQAYFDREVRGADIGGSGFYVDTADIDLQETFQLGSRNQFVVGAGVRSNQYRINGTTTLIFAPASRTLNIGDAFAQDTLSINSATRLVIGVKLEQDAYIDPVLLPNLRLSWTSSGGTTLWGAVSRAIRSPTPFDRDVEEYLGSVKFLIGDPAFSSELLTAYELGVHAKPTPRLSVSISTYYNVYSDLRSIEPAPGGFIPLRWGNGMDARTIGVEAWADYQMLPWWRVSGSFNAIGERFGFQSGASGLLGTVQAADDPRDQAQIKSSMDLPHRVSFDADLRYVDEPPNPHVAAYTELNGRLAWRVTDRIEVALVGRNLLHAYHQEYVGGAEIPRSVFADLQWRF